MFKKVKDNAKNYTEEHTEQIEETSMTVKKYLVIGVICHIAVHSIYNAGYSKGMSDTIDKVSNMMKRQ